MVRKAGFVFAVASGVVLIASGTGLAQGTSPVQVSSSSSPLASTACTSTDAGQSGKNYLNSTVEPQIAVNPKNTKNMIGMWHQDRWSNGGAHGIGVGYSTNGGNTWNETTLPADACSGATKDSKLDIYLRNSDPWVSFGPDGTAYASALAFNLGVPNWDNAVAVATSTDGGAHWNNAQAIVGSAFTQFAQSTDKNSTTADPLTAGTAYTVWDTLINPTDQPDDNPHTQSYTGPAYFSMTMNGGADWTPAKVIINTRQRQQTIGNIILVDPSTKPHTLYDFTNLITPPNTPFRGTRTTQSVAFVKSTDGGMTWTAPQVIAPFNSLGVHDPNTGQLLRVGDGLEEVAIDPSSGKLYAVWESSTNYNKSVKQSTGLWDDEILLTSSKDGGAHWTTPTVVHHLDSGLPTYTPMVAVNGERVAVTYYDNRNLEQGQTAVLPTDYWVSYFSTSDGTFLKEDHIAGSFDQLSAPFARGFFLGDYEGLQPSGSGFAALFVKTHCDAPYKSTFCGPASNTVTSSSNTNPTDVFFAALS